MPGLDEFVALLEEAQAGGAVGRARAAARAAVLLGRMTPDERQALLSVAADRAAPEVVSRLRRHGIDPDDAQADVLLDLVRDLDGDDVRRIAAAVRSPDRGEQAGGGAPGREGGPGADSGAPRPLPDGAAAVPAAAGDDPELAALEQRLADTQAELAAAEQRLEQARAARPRPPHTRLDDRHDDVPRDDLEDLLPELAEHDDLEAGAPDHDESERDEPSHEDRLDEHLAEFDSPLDFVIGEGPPVAPGPAAGPEPQPAPLQAPAGPAAAGPEGEETGPDLLDQVRRVRRPLDTIRLLRRSAADFNALPPGAQQEVLLAVPDGWVRRRALEGLVRSGAVAAERAAGLLEVLGRTMDRVWVTATMLEDDLLHAGQLDGLVGERHAARLRRRYGQPGA